LFYLTGYLSPICETALTAGGGAKRVAARSGWRREADGGPKRVAARDIVA